MENLSVIPAICLFSVFWILAFLKLQKLENGLVLFFKHFGANLVVCILLTIGAFQLFIGDQSLGFDGILYWILAWFGIIIIWFVWSIIVFNKAKALEKRAQATTTNEDILDN